MTEESRGSLILLKFAFPFSFRSINLIWWWAGIIVAPLSGLGRVIILIILANIRAGFICLRVLNLSVVIIPTHYLSFCIRSA